jgi:hypothetical protein
MENSSERSQTVHSNIGLIYSYTESQIKYANDSLNALNTKLASIIAVSGAAINFSINLPNHAFIENQSQQIICYSCLILKIVVCGLLITALCFGIIGFAPQAGGGVTPPRVLVDEHEEIPEDDCRKVITYTWLETLDDLHTMRDTKAVVVKKAIFALGGAGVLAASDIILASLLSML